MMIRNDEMGKKRGGHLHSIWNLRDWFYLKKVYRKDSNLTCKRLPPPLHFFGALHLQSQHTVLLLKMYSMLISLVSVCLYVCVYLAAPGIVLLVLSGDLCCSVLQGFEFDVAGGFGHKRAADVPLWLLNQQKVTQNTWYNRLTKCYNYTVVWQKKDTRSDQMFKMSINMGPTQLSRWYRLWGKSPKHWTALLIEDVSLSVIWTT